MIDDDFFTSIKLIAAPCSSYIRANTHDIPISEGSIEVDVLRQIQWNI